MVEKLSKKDKHPNIIKYDDYIIERDRNDIIMIFEYCEVKSLIFYKDFLFLFYTFFNK